MRDRSQRSVVRTFENYHRDDVVPSERSFALTLGALITVLALWRAAGTGRWWLIAVAAVVVALGLLAPAALRPLNRAWLWFALRLGRVGNTVVLVLLYVVVVTPMAVILRSTGRDPLRLRVPGTQSMWHERDPGEPAPNWMTRQY